MFLLICYHCIQSRLTNNNKTKTEETTLNPNTKISHDKRSECFLLAFKSFIFTFSRHQWSVVVTKFVQSQGKKYLDYHLLSLMSFEFNFWTKLLPHSYHIDSTTASCTFSHQISKHSAATLNSNPTLAFSWGNFLSDLNNFRPLFHSNCTLIFCQIFAYALTHCFVPLKSTLWWSHG